MPSSFVLFLRDDNRGSSQRKWRIQHGVAMSLLVIAALVAFLPLSWALNPEGVALYALRQSLNDPRQVLQSWDPNVVNPCTWFHVSCDAENSVIRVDLGNAGLSGTLVPELGNLHNLQFLELYNNTISGRIPCQLGNLKALVSLDLYDNDFTDCIPTSLGKLSNLRFLRLNSNLFTCRIPHQLTTISTLKVVDFSNNNLCGTVPLSGYFKHLQAKSFENNPRLNRPCHRGGSALSETSCY